MGTMLPTQEAHSLLPDISGSFDNGMLLCIPGFVVSWITSTF